MGLYYIPAELATSCVDSGWVYPPMGRPTMVPRVFEAMGLDMGFGFSGHSGYNVDESLFLCTVAQTVDEKSHHSVSRSE
jgi:hypothetical protein